MSGHRRRRPRQRPERLGWLFAVWLLAPLPAAAQPAQPEKPAQPEELAQPEKPAADEREELQSGEPAEEEQEEETAAPSPLPAFAETVVVTASRAETPLLTAPAAITVRSAEELASEAARTFADLFDGIPGISIQGNARRITEAPNIRGFADQQVVVRQDGARQNFNAAHGGRFFTDPDLLERVEVLRGANSAVFGSGALGGVVSLTTRDARDLLAAGENFGGRYRVGFQSNGRDLSQSLAAFGAKDSLEALASVTLGGTGQPTGTGRRSRTPRTKCGTGWSSSGGRGGRPPASMPPGRGSTTGPPSPRTPTR